MGKKSRSTVSTKRRSRTSQLSLGEKVTLERILGLTSQSNSSLTCCPCGTGCVAYAAGCVIIIFNPKKNKQEFLFNVSRKTITALAFSQDGKNLVSGECGHNPAVRVWDVKERTEVCSFTGHKFGITCVAFIPVTGYVVSVGEQHDMVINVWDWKSGSGRVSSGKIATMVTDIAFSEDGNTFVTVGNRSVKFWYFSGKSKTRQTLPLHGRNSILGEQKNHMFCSVTFGCDGNSDRVYAVTRSGLLCEFNEDRMLDKWVELRTRQAYCITANDDHLFVGCADGVMRIFSASTLHFVTSLPKPHDLKIDVAAGTNKDHIFSPKENATYPDSVATVVDPLNKKLTCIYSDHSLYVWDIHDVYKIGKQWSFLYHSSCIWGVDVYPDLAEGHTATLPPNTFSTCSSDNTIRIWNIDPAMDTNIFNKNIYSPELLKVLYSEDEDSYEEETSGDGNKEGVRCLCFSPDGQMLASGDRSGNIKVYDLFRSNMTELHRIEAHDAEVLCLEFSEPDTGYNLLASASRDRFIHIFDMNKNCSLLQTLDDHSSSITSVKFANSNGRFQMMSCGADKALLVRVATWDPDLQFSLLHNVGSKTTLYDMAVDVSEKYVATACQDRNLRIHNINSGKLKQTYKGSQSDDGTLIRVTLDPSGMYAATSCSDKTLAIFDFYSGACMATMMGHSELVTGLKFTNDCQRLISVSGDGCIFVWKLPFDMTNNMKDRISERNQRMKMVAQFTQVRRKTFVVPDVAASIHLDSDTTEDHPAEVPPDDEDGPPDYRFSISGLPAWAQKKVAGEVVASADQSSKPALPRGKWAQNVATEGFLMMADETTIQVKPLDQQERRRYSFESEALDDDDDDEELFIPAEQVFNAGEGTTDTSLPFSPVNKIRCSRGSDVTALSRESSVVESVDGDDDEGEGSEGGVDGPEDGGMTGTDGKEEEEDVQEEIIIYPEGNASSTESLDFQVTESTESIEELERRKHKRANSKEMLLKKKAEGSVEIEGDLAPTEISDDDDDDTPDVTPNVTPLPSPVRKKAWNPLAPEEEEEEEDELFLHENFTFQAKERFDQCLEQLTSRDQENPVIDRRMSITGRFIQRSRFDSTSKRLDPKEVLGEILKKRQEDTRRAVEAMRRRLEMSSVTSIKEVKTPPTTPKEEATPFPPPAGADPSNQSRRDTPTDKSETGDTVDRTTQQTNVSGSGTSDTNHELTREPDRVAVSSEREQVEDGGRENGGGQFSISRPRELKLPQVIGLEDQTSSQTMDSGTKSEGTICQTTSKIVDTQAVSNRPSKEGMNGLSSQEQPSIECAMRETNSDLCKESVPASTESVDGGSRQERTAMQALGAKTRTNPDMPKGVNSTKDGKAKTTDDISKDANVANGHPGGKDGKPVRGRSILSPMKRSSSLSRIAQSDTGSGKEAAKSRVRRSLSTDRQMMNKNNPPNTSARQKHRTKADRTSSPLLKSYEMVTESTLAKIKRKIVPGGKRSRKSLPPSGPMRATGEAIKPPESNNPSSGERLKPPAERAAPAHETSEASSKEKKGSSEEQKGTSGEVVKEEPDDSSVRTSKQLTVAAPEKVQSSGRLSNGGDQSAEGIRKESTPRDVDESPSSDETDVGGKGSLAEGARSSREEDASRLQGKPAEEDRQPVRPKMNGDIVQLLQPTDPVEATTMGDVDGLGGLGATATENGPNNLVSVLEDSVKQMNENFSHCLSTLTEIKESGNVADFNKGLASLSSTYASMGSSLDDLKRAGVESLDAHNGSTDQREMQTCITQFLHPEGTNGTRRDGDIAAQAAMNLLEKYSAMLVTMVTDKLNANVNAPPNVNEDSEEDRDDRDVIDC